MKNKSLLIATVLIIAVIIGIIACKEEKIDATQADKTNQQTEVSVDTRGITEEMDIIVDTVFLPEKEADTEESDQIIEGSDAPYGSRPDDTEHINEEIVFGEDEK